MKVTYDRPVQAVLVVRLANGEEWEATDDDVRRFGWARPGETAPPPDPDPALPIEELDLTIRTYNVLKRERLSTVADLLRHAAVPRDGDSRPLFFDFRNFGFRNAKEVLLRLAQYGFVHPDLDAARAQGWWQTGGPAWLDELGEQDPVQRIGQRTGLDRIDVFSVPQPAGRASAPLAD